MRDAVLWKDYVRQQIKCSECGGDFIEVTNDTDLKPPWMYNRRECNYNDLYQNELSSAQFDSEQEDSQSMMWNNLPSSYCDFEEDSEDEECQSCLNYGYCEHHSDESDLHHRLHDQSQNENRRIERLPNINPFRPNINPFRPNTPARIFTARLGGNFEFPNRNSSNPFQRRTERDSDNNSSSSSSATYRFERTVRVSLQTPLAQIINPFQVSQLNELFEEIFDFQVFTLNCNNLSH